MNPEVFEYKESMRRLTFSDETKERMIGNLIRIDVPQKGGVMKKGIKTGKIVAIAAACVMIFGITVAASGIAKGVVSHNRLSSRTGNFEKLADYEEETGLDVKAVETFANGYAFDCLEINDSTVQDGDFNDLESYSGIGIQYKKKDCPSLSVYMDPARMSDESFDKMNAQENREINGITLYYSKNEYLLLPVTKDNPDPATEEERNRAENDPHFFISYGSPERETRYISSVHFYMNDVSYDIISSDTEMTGEEMMDMAEEIISADSM